MKYLNTAILIFIICIFSIVVYFGITSGWSNLFILPIITISGYALFYLHSQLEKEDKERLEQSVKYAMEDNEAEIWMKDTFVPQAIFYSRKKRRTIIIYSFLFIIGIYFLWQFINNGLVIAIRDVIYICILFWIFIFYIYTAPHIFNWFSKTIPKGIKKYGLGDWGRAYLFLIPVAFFIYLFYPVEKALADIHGRLASFPIFFLAYTFSFLGIYSIIYITKEIQKDEKKQLEKEIKELL